MVCREQGGYWVIQVAGAVVGPVSATLWFLCYVRFSF